MGMPQLEGASYFVFEKRKKKCIKYFSEGNWTYVHAFRQKQELALYTLIRTGSQDTYTS